MLDQRAADGETVDRRLFAVLQFDAVEPSALLPFPSIILLVRVVKQPTLTVVQDQSSVPDVGRGGAEAAAWTYGSVGLGQGGPRRRRSSSRRTDRGRGAYLAVSIEARR